MLFDNIHMQYVRIVVANSDVVFIVRNSYIVLILHLSMCIYHVESNKTYLLTYLFTSTISSVSSWVLFIYAGTEHNHESASAKGDLSPISCQSTVARASFRGMS